MPNQLLDQQLVPVAVRVQGDHIPNQSSSLPLMRKNRLCPGRKSFECAQKGAIAGNDEVLLHCQPRHGHSYCHICSRQWALSQWRHKGDLVHVRRILVPIAWMT